MPISPKDADLAFANFVLQQIEKQLALHNFSISGNIFSEEVSSEPLPDSVIAYVKAELKNLGYGNVRYNPRPDDKTATVFQVVHYPGESVEFPLSDLRQAELDKVIAYIDNCLSFNTRTFIVSWLIKACDVHRDIEARMIYEIMKQYSAAGWKVVQYETEKDGERVPTLQFTTK